jgi:hypothetical protein
METQQTSLSRSENVENLQEPSHILAAKVDALSPNMFLAGAAASIAFSLFLRITGRRYDAQFVGQWAPTLLLLGLYTREGRTMQPSSERSVSGQGVLGREVH